MPENNKTCILFTILTELIYSIRYNYIIHYGCARNNRIIHSPSKSLVCVACLGCKMFQQSYKIKLPSQAFLYGRSLLWRKLRQVAKCDVGKQRYVTTGAVKYFTVFFCLQMSTHCATYLNFQQRKATEFEIHNWSKEVT